MSEATANLLDGQQVLRSLGQTEVKGKNIKINIFTIEGE
jgi:hypothetical protein